MKSIAGDANIENLVLDTSQYAVDALWQEHYGKVCSYTLINMAHFALLVLFVVYGMGNNYFRFVNSLASVLMLCVKFIEYSCSDSFEDYMHDMWNIMDVSGNLCVLMYQVLILSHKANLEDIYASRVFLVVAVLFLGIRALSQMRIVE